MSADLQAGRVRADAVRMMDHRGRQPQDPLLDPSQDLGLLGLPLGFRQACHGLTHGDGTLSIVYFLIESRLHGT